MKNIFLVVATVSLLSCDHKPETDMNIHSSIAGCNDDCGKTEFSCKLTSPELQQRKATVIEHLKKEILETRELNNGYAYKFPGTDQMIDELTAFIKTERECCDFFTFTISAAGDKSVVWLELTGEEGVKDFIKSELEF